MPMPFSTLRRWASASKWGRSKKTAVYLETEEDTSTSPEYSPRDVPLSWPHDFPLAVPIVGSSTPMPGYNYPAPIHSGGSDTSQQSWSSTLIAQPDDKQPMSRSKGKQPATKEDEKRWKDEEEDTDPNRISYNFLRTSSPQAQGQSGFRQYLTGDNTASASILEARDRAERLAKSAPQVTGTRATHRWLRDPSPQNVAVLLAEMDAADPSSGKRSMEFLRPWAHTLPSPRPDREPEWTIFSLGCCPGHMATCGVSSGCNSGNPPPFTEDNARASMLVEAHRDSYEEARTTSSDRRPVGAENGESSAVSETRWASAPEEEDYVVERGRAVRVFLNGGRSRSNEDSYPDGEVEPVNFPKPQLVDISKQGEASITPRLSSEQSVFEGEGPQEDGGSDYEDQPLSPFNSPFQENEAYDVCASQGECINSPPVSPRSRRHVYFDESEDGHRIVPCLEYLPAFYPYRSVDGMARVSELYELCGIPPYSPNHNPADVLLTLLRTKPTTRAFMARGTPGVARRANQIYWMSIHCEISKDEDRKLFLEWEQSREPLFPTEEEETNEPVGEVADKSKADRSREKVKKVLQWKPSKSKLSEETSP